ncbi:MAG TPA: hypothetical protein VN328_01515 [Thermodesulfovibrionales bacterium]|nr:hypothetical protein [Thermodesulfovibrionales bacterium]
MRHICNEDGWIKPLFTMSILVLAVYSGFQFGMPYYRHSAFQNEAKAIARVSSGDLNKVKEDVYASAREFKVPIEEKDLKVEKIGGRIRIRTSWSQEIDILGLYQKTLDFSVDVEE